MPVRLGISPIGWSNDDLPELGGDTPLHTCLAEARLAGYDGIELGHKFPRDPAILRPILERFGLALISGWYSGRLLERSVGDEIAAIEAHCTLLVAMGCRVLVYAETSGSIAGDRRRALSSRPRLDNRNWHDFGARLTELADHLSGRGIGLVYHHHIGTVVESDAEIDHLMAVTGDQACRATAASISPECSRSLRRLTTMAGWLSRPSRTRQQCGRSSMPGSALPG